MRLLDNAQKKTRNLRFAVAHILISLMMLLAAAAAGAVGEPKTVAEIALYQGPDREKILMEGARKEGHLTYYNSHVVQGLVGEFEKKYPFIKVSEWRTEAKEMFRRIREEYTAGRFLADVIATADLMVFLRKEGILQEYFSPQMLSYEDEYKVKGKTGIYYLANWENHIGLGYNTERISRTEAPKNLKDLLDPKWKGKLSIAGSTTSIKWIGNAVEAMGPDFIDKLNVKVQNISGSALLGLVASGEVPLSPTILDDNVYEAKKKGAPVEWRPLEPVVTNIDSSGMSSRAPHPYAALLFLDFVHAREGQQVMMNVGLSSPRKDMGSAGTKFKKTIWQARYEPEELENKYNEWSGLLKKLIVKGK